MDSSYTAEELALACAQAAYETKAENICIYDVRGHSSLTDYCVICTATSIPHLRAIVRDLDSYVVDHTQANATYKDSNPESLWCVLDYIDVMVHVQTEGSREFYALDDLWKVGKKIDWTPQL